ncbi:aldo/keto reductase [Plantactinospora sp. S1510]|uniref:Aldo/keto reductase n=1 Tax=Plantactinospora alkalitolerans TaxID=2789879 RepID=A0ABS0GNS4_9ACTN|nr:aldo/keto reductase [Plantactinospora alkalitolerans]MBF9127841.1 aldo/keto reductase [Plantactinospora alkalitolerans]
MAKQQVPMVTLPSGEAIPALGQGTWGMAEDPRRRNDEIAALQAGVDAGLTVIDTAEVYADGGAEELVREALGDRREEIFLISKISSEHATGNGTGVACERSLERLGTDRIDLYLLHQRGSAPLPETVEAFTNLMTQGLIRHWGVSNFDVPEVVELTGIPGGTSFETDQIPYNLTRRGIEWDLLPRCRAAGLPVMAYSPLERGRMLDHPALAAVAERHGGTPGQVGLAWLLAQPGVCTVTKASSPSRVLENRAAVELTLTDDDLAELDRAFPPPSGPRPLELL